MILLLNMCKVNLFIHKILCRFPFVLEILTKAGRKSGEVSIFLDHVNFQKIEINFFYKIILMKTRLAVPFKLETVLSSQIGFPRSNCRQTSSSASNTLWVRVSSRPSSITVSFTMRLSLNSFAHRRNISYLIFPRCISAVCIAVTIAI